MDYETTHDLSVANTTVVAIFFVDLAMSICATDLGNTAFFWPPRTDTWPMLSRHSDPLIIGVTVIRALFLTEKI